MSNHSLASHVESAPARAPDYDYASVVMGIPETFTEDQAHLILLLKGSPPQSVEAQNLIRATGRFTEAQRLCVLSLLKLRTRDFCATLADGMESCALRGTLMRWRDGDAHESPANARFEH